MKCVCQESWSSWIDPKCPNHGNFSKTVDYEQVAKELWMLLDDISTLGDVLKPEINQYFKSVNYICEKRNKYFTSNGYELFPTKK